MLSTYHFFFFYIQQEVLNSSSYQGFETVLETLALICPVILIQPCKTEVKEGETVTNELISRYPRITPALIPEHRLLHHKTEIGKVAILRQLRPSLHIEYDHSVCTQVAPFMRVITVVIDSDDVVRSDAHASATVHETYGSLTGGVNGTKSSSASAPYSSMSSVLELLRVP